MDIWYHEAHILDALKFIYQQGREDAIEKLMKEIKDTYGYDYYSDLIQVAEQIKE